MDIWRELLDTLCTSICSLFNFFSFFTARKRATFDKFGEEGLRDGLPPELGNNQYWSNKYTYHGNPEKTFREFFGGNNPFAGRINILCAYIQSIFNSL